MNFLRPTLTCCLHSMSKPILVKNECWTTQRPIVLFFLSTLKKLFATISNYSTNLIKQRKQLQHYRPSLNTYKRLCLKLITRKDFISTKFLCLSELLLSIAGSNKIIKDQTTTLKTFIIEKLQYTTF
ncbi:conserved hypothetical protein [Streptococcus intermedius JTH08]|nr:conserved hypothetical protein [Streptococcus intermedius JTH08]